MALNVLAILFSQTGCEGLWVPHLKKQFVDGGHHWKQIVEDILSRRESSMLV